ncbi:MAG: hypothetical protein K1000chlam1_01101 [Candidatus Anoxychlamydiales bacterium]|nr:hypothetical protein [Candidatus Anoxychlamydiales bacterium]
MKLLRLLFSFILSILIITFIVFIIFLWWNSSPALSKRSNSTIIKLDNKESPTLNKKFLKVVSYNIHFGIGLNGDTTKVDKKYFEKRLDKIGKVLKDIDADIVLLQEVDFHSKRSHFIDQGEYLASKAGYSFVTKASTQRKKIHLFYHNVVGKIEQGLCILSKHPIEQSESMVFDYSSQMPFFVKWLYDPHGAQKCIINYQNKPITLINIHLEPWDSEARLDQIKTIISFWLNHQSYPTIIGGDFNSISRSAKKTGYYLLDAPWFIDKSSFDISKDKTIPTLMNLGFKEALPSKLSLHHKKNYTFPANSPLEKLDYIFVGSKARIIKSYIYEEAKTSSDHLPIVATIKINNN